MIAGNIPGETQTIPLYIYDAVQSPGGLERSGRLVLMSVLLAAGALMLAEYLDRRAAWRTGRETPQGVRG